MAFCIVVDPNLTYKQALTIAYEKAKLEGPLDDALVAECELVINSPEPDVVYHKTSFEQAGTMAPCGGAYQPVSNMWSIYEGAKLRAAKYQAASLADSVQNEIELLQPAGGLRNVERFQITGEGDLEALQGGKKVDVRLLFKEFEGSELSILVNEYAKVMNVLKDQSVNFGSAPYARYFASAE